MPDDLTPDLKPGQLLARGVCRHLGSHNFVSVEELVPAPGLRVDVMALGPKALQVFRNRKIGMVFQNFALLPHRSVLDNVAMPLEIRQVGNLSV